MPISAPAAALSTEPNYAGLCIPTYTIKYRPMAVTTISPPWQVVDWSSPWHSRWSSIRQPQPFGEPDSLNLAGRTLRYLLNEDDPAGHLEWGDMLCHI